MSRNYLSMNEALFKGDSLLSNDGGYKAIFQDDGNFVVYGWRPVWASNTCGIIDANRLIMQADGNLVLYTPCKPVWATNSNRANAGLCRLTLTNEGILTVQSENNVVWKSTKSC